jgi:molecular chaperone HtpG
VLLLDGQLDVHMINHLETKLKDSRFVRVDSDVIDNLIRKDENRTSKLNESDQNDLRSLFTVKGRPDSMFHVVFEPMGETDSPVIITQSEFIRRMKDMSAMGGGMNFYGEMPDSFNLVVNTNHPLVLKINEELHKENESKLNENLSELKRIKEEIDFMEEDQKKKKPEEVAQVEKDDLAKLQTELTIAEGKRRDVVEAWGTGNKTVKQLIDLALLSNNMLKGEDLAGFVKRSVDLL